MADDIRTTETDEMNTLINNENLINNYLNITLMRITAPEFTRFLKYFKIKLYLRDNLIVLFILCIRHLYYSLVFQ